MGSSTPPCKGDWIQDYCAWLDGVPSPPQFILWSAISAIAGALERRCWIETARSTLYPNLYTMLVAPPGVGKNQAIDQARLLWRDTKVLKIAPKSVTRASLADAIAGSERLITTTKGNLVQYNSLLITAGELGVLLPAHDLEFLSVLNDLYDNPPDYIETRRTGNKKVEIICPQINIMSGAQPGFLASLLPEEAWNMGTMSRMIMVYAASGPIVPLFYSMGEDDEGDLDRAATEDPLRVDLLSRMVQMTDLLGRFSFSALAKALIMEWHQGGCLPVPEHSKLQHYLPRRIIHCLKLCMVAAVSRSGALRIEGEDFLRAKSWLLQAEHVMPDIFRDMVHRSDADVLQELHYFLWRVWAKNGKRAIHESMLYNFLSTKVPSERIPKVLEIAEKSNIVTRMIGTSTYVPRAKHEHGVE